MKVTDVAFRIAVDRIRPILEETLRATEGEFAFIIQGKDEVIQRYQPLFQPENIGSISAEDFKSFLNFSNNHHWKGIQRASSTITQDMDFLHRALEILVDESRPISERLTKLITKKGGWVPRLGRAIITPILLVTYPDKYGVWNTISEAGMIRAGVWPQLDQKAPFGKRYEAVNEILVALATELHIDLWTLDAIWWNPKLGGDGIIDNGGDNTGISTLSTEVNLLQRFGLERYLQEFIRDNWDRISELRGWQLYEEDGDQVGYEYNTHEIGRIDLLAHHKTDPAWLVIELKRDQTSDETIGQVLRYIGWVKKNKAISNEKVRGMVICQAVDTKMEYALTSVQDVDLLLYEIDFHLRKTKPND